MQLSQEEQLFESVLRVASDACVLTQVSYH